MYNYLEESFFFLSIIRSVESLSFARQRSKFIGKINNNNNNNEFTFVSFATKQVWFAASCDLCEKRFLKV